MKTRKPTVAEMREMREHQERRNRERAHARAEIKRSRRSTGLDPEAPFIMKDWRGLGVPVDNTGKKPEDHFGVVRFFASEHGSLGWQGAAMRRKARDDHKKRSANWESTRREMAAKGENTGTQANHNARRAKARAKTRKPKVAA